MRKTYQYILALLLVDITVYSFSYVTADFTAVCRPRLICQL